MQRGKDAALGAFTVVSFELSTWLEKTDFGQKSLVNGAEMTTNEWIEMKWNELWRIMMAAQHCKDV